jgi:hypothetical protein
MPYLASTYYRIPGMVAAPGKLVIPGANTSCYVPVKFDQDVDITTIGFSCGATVASGKAQCAVYAADPVTRLPTGLPLFTAPEATCATLNNNGNFILNATWSAVADTLYWIFVIGSTSAVGFNAGQSSTLHDEIGGAGMANMDNAGDVIGSLVAAGQTYASTVSWLDFTAIAYGTSKAYAPLLWFKRAA